MAETRRVTLAQRLAAEALIERAELMGRPIPADTLAKARAILHDVAEQEKERARRQKPIGNPA